MSNAPVEHFEQGCVEKKIHWLLSVTPTSMDPTYPLVPVANFISSFLVVLALLVSAGRPWNIGVCMFALWTALSCMVMAINTIVWKDNFDNVAPIWCDLSTHFTIGLDVAMPACSLVITRRIAQITSLRVIKEKGQRFREDIVDLILCIGIPVLHMIVYYVVQGSRFQILEEFGCAPTAIGSGVEILLLEVWYVSLPLISITLYLPKIIWHYYQRRREMNDYLSSSGSMSHGTYLRILCLGCLDMLVNLPIGILGLVVDIKENFIVFYQGWSVIHTNWGPEPVTRQMWTDTPFGTFDLKWNEWIGAFYALVFFALFGLTREARRKYRHGLNFILRPVGLRPISTDQEPELSEVYFGSQHVRNDTISESLGSSTNSDNAFAIISHLEEGKKFSPASKHEKDEDSQLQ